MGATCLTAVRRASGAKVVALRLYQTMNTLNIILIFLVYNRRLSALASWRVLLGSAQETVYVTDDLHKASLPSQKRGFGLI